MLECLVLCVLVALPCCTAASPTLDYLGRQGVRVCAYMCVRMRVCDVCVLCVCVRVRVMLVCVSAYMCVCVWARDNIELMRLCVACECLCVCVRVWSVSA
jgi:hypothetical protein